MFTFDEVKIYLSKPAKDKLVDGLLYTAYATQATNIVVANAGILAADKPDWALVPFCRIIEYLILNTLTGFSQQYVDLVRDNFRQALETLHQNQAETSSLAPRVGNIAEVYDANL